MSEVQPIAMPICELCDRMTIAQLKMQRLSDDQIDKAGLHKQIKYYESGIDVDNIQLRELIIDLHQINGQMWDAEYDIRKGLDDDLGLEEVGRRAIRISDLNSTRVAVKNQIAELTGQSEFKDCKMNHISS